MRLILTTLFTLFSLTTCPAPAQAEFTQADRERMIQLFTKVEEMDKRFDQLDKRIDDLRTDTNNRFEQVDKRIDELRRDMNNRFEQVDKRFEQVDKRFEQVDKRFVELRDDMNARFVQVNSQFAQVNNQFETITNLMTAIIAAFVAIVLMTVGFALWDRRSMLRQMEKEVVKVQKAASEKVEQQIQEVSTKVENLEKQVTQVADADTAKRRRIQDVLAEMGGKGGEDARLASVLRGLL
jgi:septal ring factor EnvC (AmiA/AmiB activator)